MALDILKERGTPLDRQRFTWREIVGSPFSKLDADAFTRLRVIIMNGIEMESLRFQHSFARMNRDLRRPLAEVRRVEQHQQHTVNWLLPADHSPLETTIAYEQVAVELTAAVALQEPDPYMAQVYRFGLLEDYDHLYRYSALLDRLEGKDSQNIVQYYSDVTPGRPTLVEHRAPVDDLREPYNMRSAAAITKLNALTILSAEQQTHNYYANIGPLFADPVARLLYAEIGHIEEQHVTQYESIIDPDETWLEKWLLHEASEVYNYWSCHEQEDDARIKAIWARFLDYELGHLHFVIDLFQRIEARDAAELVPATLPDPIDYRSHRDFVRQVLANERHLRAVGTRIVDPAVVPESEETLEYRRHINSEGSPSEIVAAGYQWRPGTTAGKQVIRGKSPSLLIDKLGERLAFERAGSRLYEVLLAKHDGKGSFPGGPAREDLAAIRDEEVRHAEIVRAAIERLGGDPTAMTPAADVAGVASMGLLQVISDPRTTLAQSLEAMLIAELADTDGWRLLIDLARAFGQDEIADSFTLPLAAEERHLELCRRWVSSHAMLEARGEAEAEKKAA